MKIVIVTICLISLMIVVFLGIGIVGFLGLAGGEMAIDGFSDTLIDGLYEQYGITVPEDAKFIKGLYSRTMNESRVVVLFECPLNDAGEDLSKYVYGILKLDKKGYRSVSRHYAEIKADWFEDMGGHFEYGFDHVHDLFDHISFSVKDDKLLIRFIGYRPRFPID